MESTEGLDSFTNISHFDTTHFYEQTYFTSSSDDSPTVGYSAYDDGPWAERLAKLIREFFAPLSVLDVGCARGYVIHHLKKAGITSFGMDYSSYALHTAPTDVQSCLLRGDAAHLPIRTDAFDTLVCFETLEHLYPSTIPTVAQEIARCATRWILLSIPTFGLDQSGHSGIPIEDPEHQIDAEANRPFRKLILDQYGNPHHGHLTLATWDWWTQQFEACGLFRIRWLEQILNQHPFAADSATTWHFYIFAPRPYARSDWSLPTEATMSSITGWQLGEGWHPIEGISPDAYRWTKSAATVTLQRVHERALIIEGAGGPRSTGIIVEINGYRLGPFSVSPGWQPQEIRIILPPMTESTLHCRIAVAETFTTSDQREVGILVWRIALH